MDELVDMGMDLVTLDPSKPAPLPFLDVLEGAEADWLPGAGVDLQG